MLSILKRDVSVLNIGAYSMAFLRGCEIRTIGTLIHHSRENLATVGGRAGIADAKLYRTLNEIELALAENGLRLASS